MRRRGATGKRGPRLLAIVYATSLSLVLLSVGALVWLAGELVTATASRSTLAADGSIARDYVARGLELDPATGAVTLDATELGASSLGSLAATHGYLRVALFSTDGQVLAGNPASDRAAVDADLASALAGQTRATIVETGAEGGSAGPPTLVEHLPVMIEDRLITVVQIQRDATAIVADVQTSRSSIAIVAVVGAVVLAFLLYLIFRTAQTRLMLQDRQLAEAARRDPLTGVLNHGAVVEMLAAEIEAARPSDRGVGIALIDIDNFTLLNDTHGHAAGDFVLSKIARELETEGIAWSAIGRYGPDEFLVVAPDDAARALEPTLHRLSRRLDDTALSFETGDPLPVTISAGVAHYPWHARSVTELLSAATVALGEARIGGGHETRTAGAWEEETRPGRGPFDVLTGLVIAIDTKDRYTKRHSEEVAAYALFLAQQLDLDESVLEAIRTAGLLHDIGKIGTPDDILRKPGRLTAREQDIVKQHVALGDLIVRDLPESGLVRAAIRHHHERWDGKGYLAGLSGESIPFIARVLSVADAFSAMTTNRPYRKALGVQDALRRIRDASGTQLDARLAEVFVHAMETAPDAPIPNEGPARVKLWAPPRPATA